MISVKEAERQLESAKKAAENRRKVAERERRKDARKGFWYVMSVLVGFVCFVSVLIMWIGR